MIKEYFIDDFDYLYNALATHPLLLEKANRVEFENLYEKLKREINDYSSFIDAMTELTMFFKDGHTNIEIPYTEQDYCLRIACEWQEDRLILKEAYANIEAGAEIIAIEAVEIGQVLEWMYCKIPHENRYLVKSRMIEYPFKNYHVFSQMNLADLFGDKNSFEVTFKVNGDKLTKQCVLEKYDGYIDFQEDNFVYYDVRGGTAVLHLDECIFNEEYKQTLEELATLCCEKNLGVLELNLSKNMGGSSAVIDEFIKYVNVENFRRYEMIDYSSGRPVCITRRTNIIHNPKKDVLFPKKIVCRVSNTTFSSARTFAVTLKDNGIATIVGQPTGGKPSSYGMPKRDKTPNFNIRFRVSRCLFLRPDERLDNEMALFPD